MRYTALERYDASEVITEALARVLGEVEEVGYEFCGDPVMRKLYDDLQDLAYRYDKHHEELRDEARFYEEEEAM